MHFPVAGFGLESLSALSRCTRGTCIRLRRRAASLQARGGHGVALWHACLAAGTSMLAGGALVLPAHVVAVMAWILAGLQAGTAAYQAAIAKTVREILHSQDEEGKS